MTSDDLFPQRSALMAVANLRLADADWPRFRALLAAAAEDGWSVRDSSHRWALSGGLSHGGGAHIGYKQWAWTSPPEPGATFYVVAPRGEDGWRAAAEALFRRLDREWPGALRLHSELAS